jgi:hypothetical protein
MWARNTYYLLSIALGQGKNVSKQGALAHYHILKEGQVKKDKESKQETLTHWYIIRGKLEWKT